MPVQLISGMMAFLGTVFVIWALLKNAKTVGRVRMAEIEKQVESVGGTIVKVEKIDREVCPYSDGFDNPDMMVKFYRIRYEVEDKRKLGYGILTMKQNWYGPSLAADTKWIWHF